MPKSRRERRPSARLRRVETPQQRRRLPYLATHPHQRPTNPAPPPSTTKKDAAPPEPRTGGYDGCTGRRGYGPNGTSLDEKGRRYTEIPCPWMSTSSKMPR